MRVETVHRITGLHLLLDDTGAAAWLEFDAGDDWALVRTALLERVHHACHHAGFGKPPILEHHYEGGIALALKAQPDALYTMCAVLEWATSEDAESGEFWDAILSEKQTEQRPRLNACHAWARSHGLPALDDEDAFTLGMGKYSTTWPLDSLPSDEQLAGCEAKAIPLAYLTGTNGKTTTTRMVARIAQMSSLKSGNTSSDGIIVNGEPIEEGDWTGPGAARMVLRHPDVEIALLETARGGLMRRGLVLPNADVALVTNISADHLGQWGILDVDALADAKLVVARSVKPGGTLVLNKDCPILGAAFERMDASFKENIDVAWFSTRDKADTSELAGWLDQDDLVLRTDDNAEFRLSVKSIPLTLGGTALHNIQNAIAAGLVALKLGLPLSGIQEGLNSLKPNVDDSRGRSNLYTVDDKYLLLDFAHNPGGLKMMAELSKRWPTGGRYFLIGQAGDRNTALVEELALEAVAIGLDHVVVKNLPKHAYERDPSEVAQSQIDALYRAGQKAGTITHVPDEVEAAEALIDMAGEKSLIFLIAHENVDGIMEMLDRRNAVLATLPEELTR
jgi:UDP-N-acetylmuramyl tripeptide synthase